MSVENDSWYCDHLTKIAEVMLESCFRKRQSQTNSCHILTLFKFKYLLQEFFDFVERKCPSNLIAPLIKIVIEEIRKACKKQPMICGFNPADNAYEPLKLMQTVMAKTNEVCLRYLDNSMLCSLPVPGTPFCVTSVYAMKNSRKSMEDRHVVIHDLNTMFNIQEASPSSYYAVFDGHAGQDAAAYSAAHLHQFLAENKHFVSNPEQALMDAFCKTDALFVDKCKVENLSSGTTAVVALLRPKEKTLFVAWAGDSQALLVNQGRVLQVVNPHKPCRQDEKERIEKDGGCVMLWGTWRVNGQLAVSRAIGDAEYKPYVIAVPEIRELPLDGGEDFLIVACDGLWDFLSEDCAAAAVYRLIAENPDDTDRISQHLVHQSKKQGSTDNISVIVVFLREPSKIAADARRVTTMETSLENATNNPFGGVQNGGAADDGDLITQKTPPSDGLLLNLTDNFKQNGSDLSPSDYKPNGNRRVSGRFDDDDDFGPETDIDALDYPPSPSAAAVDEGVCNPFVEHQEKAALEMERHLKQREEEEEGRLAREETPTPPADAVHDVGGVVDNAAESDSEDEWNYIKGEEAIKENVDPLQPETKVAEIPEEDDNMSQLNPNAAEFVPVSPTRSIPSPSLCRLMNDPVIAESPKRPVKMNIKLPDEKEFEMEVKSRPSEVDSAYSNGRDSENEEERTTPADLMESILNGKNIDDIPEFQPGSTPKKGALPPGDEFHFGPNAAPFTPIKPLDQSEAALSTRAVFGDDSDPASASFCADDKNNDLDRVHVLPDDLEDFLKEPLLDDTISDLPEHEPLKDLPAANNDDAVRATDDEKELASPLEEPEKESADPPESDADEREAVQVHRDAVEPEEEDLGIDVEEPDFVETRENSMGPSEFCGAVEKSEPDVETEPALPPDVELISPEPAAETHEELSEVGDLLGGPAVSEVGDLLGGRVPSPDFTRPELIDEAHKHFEELCRPSEEQQDIEDSFVEDRTTGAGAVSAGSPVGEVVVMASPKDAESVATTDVDSFLDRSLPPDVESPLSPADPQILRKCVYPLRDVAPDPEPMSQQELADYLSHPLSRCVFPLPPQYANREADVESVVVGVEDAGAVVAAPAEEEKREEVLVVEETPERFVSAPTPSAPPADLTELVSETTAVGIASAVAAGAAIAAVATAAPEEKKAAPKKSAAARLGAKAPPPAATKTSAGRAAPRAAPAKPGTTKPSAAALPKTAPPNPTSKPKPIAAAKVTEKKPLANGDIKSTTTTRSNLTAKKTATGATNALKTTTSARLAPKLSPTKPAAPKPAAAAPRPAARPATATGATHAARPTTLTSRPASGTSPAKGAAATTRAPISRTSAAPRPRPPPPTTSKVSSTRTVAKTADAEKQNKESANKITASRNVTQRAAVGGARSTATTVRRVESKTSATRTTLSKTTTTTAAAAKSSSAAAKRPAEIVRTKTTKIEKPKLNGAAAETVVVEAISVSTEAGAATPLKDSSPVDNKIGVTVTI